MLSTEALAGDSQQASASLGCEVGPGGERLRWRCSLAARCCARALERTFRFCAERLGLHVYREWGSGRGGSLEVSGHEEAPASAAVELWHSIDAESDGMRAVVAGLL